MVTEVSRTKKVIVHDNYNNHVFFPILFHTLDLRAERNALEYTGHGKLVTIVAQSVARGAEDDSLRCSFCHSVDTAQSH